MDTELLVDTQIEDGLQLLTDLVRNGIDVSVAGWVRKSEGRTWYLFIGSATVGTKNVGKVYQSVYAALQRIPNCEIGLSEVIVLPATDPIARDLASVWDRRPRGWVGVRRFSGQLDSIAIEEVYIYPPIKTGMTRDEAVQAVTGLLNRTGAVRPSTLTMRDGSIIRGVPYGLEISRTVGRPNVLEVKIIDDANGSTHAIPVDEVSNILTT